ncbi:MAG: transposase [Crocinitomicaceae bacterium]|nr:MAG: transposase [Crocinitomicaceae bacterium]
MKLTLKIKLLPTDEQANLLLETMKEANTVCNAISDVAWQEKIFNNFKLHHRVYHSYKATFQLSSQMLIRQIAKVADAYKLDKKTKRTFRPLGGIAYDSRIQTYKPDNTVSLWCIGGRQKIKFVCHNPAYLPYIKGEADLVYKKGKFYLFQTVDIPEEDVEDVETFVGVDFGLVSIATLSNGKEFNSKKLQDYREKRQKVRSSVQSKRTRGSKKLLKRLSGRERTTASIINHTIAKQIVQLAKEENKGIALEDLKGIRFSSLKKGKKFRTMVGKWSFNQLRQYISYKAILNGVPVVLVNPRYTSKTCNKCHHIGNRKGKVFECNNCGNNMDSDVNASINIATLGAIVNLPEKSSMYSCALHYSDLKPIPSLCVGG